MIHARLETFETNSRRASPRRKLCLGSSLAADGQDVVIHDLSATGVLLQTTAKLATFDDIEVDLPEVGPTHAFVVWSSGEYFGCEFARPISSAAISAALLRNPAASPQPRATKDLGVLELDEEAPSSELSLSTKMRVIVGTSIALWAIILWAFGAF
jgi:PilZ domain